MGFGNVGKKKHRGIKIFFTLLLIILALLATGVIYVVMWYKDSIKAISQEKCAGNSCEIIQFTISEGDVTASIAQRLEDEGIIKSALGFRAYLMIDARDTTIKAGDYTLSKDMSVEEIVKTFNEGSKAKTFQIMFLPGGSLADARKRLQEVGYRNEDIEAAFKKQYDHPLLKGRPLGASLEGYIYGDTYEFYSTATVEDVLTRTFDEMYELIKSENLEAKYKERNLSLYQGIILASVVQGEAGIMTLEEQRTVAQIFYTRLNRGSVLGSDAIIAYRADQLNPNRDKTDMSYLDTIGCPWNSRQCAGLPPNPINSPGKNALMAVANPTDTDYYYFISGYENGKDGKVRLFYARTEAEHQANIDKYCGDLCYHL